MIKELVNKSIEVFGLKVVEKEWISRVEREIQERTLEIKELEEELERTRVSLAQYKGIDGSCINALIEAEVPVFINGGMELSMKPKGSLNHSCIIISVPKSGTYLGAKILEKIGFIDLEIHVSDKYFADYRWMNLPAKRKQDLNVIKNVDIKHVVKLIQRGQFCVGHVPHSPANEHRLNRFIRFFLVRDIRDCVVSYMRFCQMKDISGEEKWSKIQDDRERFECFLRTSVLAVGFFEMAKNVLGWEKTENTLTIRYEEMMSYGENTFRRMCTHCGVELSDEKMSKLCREAFLEPNITFSGVHSQRSKFRRYWSTEIDKLFDDFGGYEINRKLGYT